MELIELLKMMSDAKDAEDQQNAFEQLVLLTDKNTKSIVQIDSKIDRRFESAMKNDRNIGTVLELFIIFSFVCFVLLSRYGVKNRKRIKKLSAQVAELTAKSNQ